MVQLVQWSPEQLSTMEEYSDMIRPTVSSAATSADAPSWSDTFMANWERNNLVVTLGRTATLAQDYDGNIHAAYSGEWNPYTYIRTSWNDSKKAELGRAVAMGLFENTLNPDEVEFRAERFRHETDLLDRIERGPAFAATLGGIAGVRILAKSATESGAIRPPVLLEAGHLFWWKPAVGGVRRWWLSGAS